MNRDPSQRVVVTGMGVVSPLGVDMKATWDSLAHGRSGIAPITLFDPSRLSVRIAGEVPDFDPERLMSRKQARNIDRSGQFAIAAAAEACDEAGFPINDTNSDRVGVIIGCGIGGITTLSEQFQVMFERGPERLSPFIVPKMLPNMASGQVSIFLHARGPNLGPTSACSSASDAIGLAAATLRRGEADVMITGGAEAAICEIGIAGFAAARALSTHNEEPQRASRPFNRQRDGFVMGEGAGALVLERAESALDRSARIHAELVGYANVSDAHHITQPAENGAGGARVMAAALKQAHLEPEEVDYINAHGTSTPLNDRLETIAIKHTFGEAAYGVAISSTKSMTGHLLGAAGALEAIACIKAITESILPPTINLDDPDPACDLDYVPNEARPANVRIAMSNSMGFGGHNACLIFKRWEE